jgi:molybdopterin/thiamine biosynthesis adenylyltransferase
MELRAAWHDLRNLHQELLSFAPHEGAAFLAVEPSADRLVMRSYRVFGPEDLDGNGAGNVVLTESSQLAGLVEIKRSGHALVEAHTHPGADTTLAFSPYDDHQLPSFARYVRLKLPGKPFGALVFGRRGYAGRAYSDAGVAPLELRGVGELRSAPTWLRREESASKLDELRYDRQIRALGPSGQHRLQRLRVGVVGLGGTGSQVVQQLAHLGVRDFVLVEDDRVEPSNLPRLAGAAWWDALRRTAKTTIARRSIRRLARRAEIRRTGALRKLSSLVALAEVDLIIGCVDNDGARLILAELAAAHLVPYLDLGVGIEIGSGVESMGGRASFYLPGGPCLACADELDFAEAGEDLESEALKQVRVVRGYARDRGVEPALMPLNTAVVGLGMIELLAFATGWRSVVAFSRYDAVGGRIIQRNVDLNPDCPLCGPAFAMGDRHEIGRYALAS